MAEVGPHAQFRLPKSAAYALTAAGLVEGSTDEFTFGTSGVTHGFEDDGAGNLTITPVGSLTNPAPVVYLAAADRFIILE